MQLSSIQKKDGVNMYIESTAIVVMLVLNVIVNIITLVVLILFAIRRPSYLSSQEEILPKSSNKQQSSVSKDDAGVVFCRNCDCKFDAQHEVCPNCKTPHDSKL